MNSQVKYVMQGFLLAVVVIVMFIAIRFLFSNNPAECNEPLMITTEPDSVYIITNTQGQYLFREKCSACHSLFGRVDPDLLQGFEERIPDKELLYAWIRNPNKIIKSGNPYFNDMYKEYGVMMTGSPELTDRQISDILAYIWQVKHVKQPKI